MSKMDTFDKKNMKLFDFDAVQPERHETEADLRKLYPKNLQLVFVALVHRHGERTPIRSYLPSFVNPVWPLCHVSSSYHAHFSNLSPGPGTADADGAIRKEPMSKTLERASAQHRMDHPAQELPYKHQEINQEKIHVETDGAHSKYISVENLMSVGPIQKHVEEMPVDETPNEDEDLTKWPSTDGNAQGYVPGQCFFGQLTDKGRETLYQMGRGLRRLYVDQLGFLPKLWDDKAAQTVFYFRSTDYPRTIEVGFYARRTARSPVVYTRWYNEETLYGASQCKRWHSLLHQFKDAYKTDKADHIQSMKDRFKHFLADRTNPNLHALYDTFIAQLAHKMPLPDGVTEKDLYDLEQHANNLWFDLYRRHPEFTRLGIGRFIKEMKNQMISAVSGKQPNLKMAIYSGHDSTVSPVASAFGVMDDRWPAFASNVTVEVFRTNERGRTQPESSEQSTENHFVRVKYNRNVVPVPHCQQDGKHLTGDKSICTWQAFMEVMDKMIPVDYEKECQMSSAS